MKKTLITFGLASVVAISANAQGIVAGWDFADVANLGQTTDGYAAERTSFNNGITTSGSIILDGTLGSTNGTQVTGVFDTADEVGFAANGYQATAPSAGDGFDTTTTNNFTGTPFGQQSLNFVSGTDGTFELVIEFTSAYNVVANFDILVDSTAGTTDMLDVSYSADGSSWSSYEPANGKYTFLPSTDAWQESDGTAGGFLGLLNAGQADMSIDLSGETALEADAIQYLRFEFTGLGNAERVGIDNIHVTGIAIPEPSAFAAIAGVLALGFVAIRRRK